VLAAALAAGALAPASGCARPPHRPDVLLITVDTLRADHMSAYGYARATTPRLDELAQDAIRFTHVQTPRAKTTPAIASLFTGLYPHDHGVRDLASPLDERVPVLAESFRAGGYRTIGVVANWVLTAERSGLSRGFEDWDDELTDEVGVPPHNAPQRRAGAVTDRALELLDLDGPPSPEGERRPWFCWLHYMDPHGIYDPPAEHRIFQGAPDWLPPRESISGHPIHEPRLADYNIPASARVDGRVDLGHVRDLYDGEIHYVDAEIGRLLDALRARGRFADTLIVFTADHGESLGEHRYWFEHGFYTYDVTCRVPLIIRLPDGSLDHALPGTRRGDASLVDLAPTLLDLVGLPPMRPRGSDRPSNTAVMGKSLDDLLRRDHAIARPVFSEKVERADLSGTVQDKAVRIGDWKFIRRYTRIMPDGPRGAHELIVLSEELFDLVADPGETTNLIADPPAAAPLSRLRSALLEFAEADVRFADLAQILQRQREDLERNDPESLRVLEALGY
jgi:arylsulfatase A-like enzyme